MSEPKITVELTREELAALFIVVAHVVPIDAHGAAHNSSMYARPSGSRNRAALTLVGGVEPITRLTTRLYDELGQLVIAAAGGAEP